MLNPVVMLCDGSWTKHKSAIGIVVIYNGSVIWSLATEITADNSSEAEEFAVNIGRILAELFGISTKIFTDSKIRFKSNNDKITINWVPRKKVRLADILAKKITKS